MSHKNPSLPANPDRAAAQALADIVSPDGRYPPESVVSDYNARMAELGVNSDDQGYLLRSLTRRAVLIETMWFQVMRDAARPAPAAAKANLLRAASRLNSDLSRTQGIILRIRNAQGEDYAPFITSQDIAVADDARPEQQIKENRLSSLQIIQAESYADQIYETQFEVLEPPTPAELAIAAAQRTSALAVQRTRQDHRPVAPPVNAGHALPLGDNE